MPSITLPLNQQNHLTLSVNDFCGLAINLAINLMMIIANEIIHLEDNFNLTSLYSLYRKLSLKYASTVQLYLFYLLANSQYTTVYLIFLGPFTVRYCKTWYTKCTYTVRPLRWACHLVGQVCFGELVLHHICQHQKTSYPIITSRFGKLEEGDSSTVLDCQKES